MTMAPPAGAGGTAESNASNGHHRKMMGGALSSWDKRAAAMGALEWVLVHFVEASFKFQIENLHLRFPS